jgi:hypothetical protein
LAWLWVGTPLAPALLGQRYVPKYDLANDLYAWEGARETLRREAQQWEQSVAVVAPHWIICAQAHAAIGAGVPVGCDSPSGDDFARWYPAHTWAGATSILYVTDDRFPSNPAARFPDRAIASSERLLVYRGGRAVRTIRITRLERKAVARTP